MDNSFLDHVKGFLDGLSISVAVATIVGWLPQIAAAMSVLWIGIQIYYFFKDRD